MPNEMIRPCTLWGHTFDACDVKGVIANVLLDAVYVEFFERLDFCKKVSDASRFNSYTNCKTWEGTILLQEATFTIAQALNAPVLATEEVLAGLPENAKAMTDNEDNECIFPFIQKSHEGWWGCLTYSMRDECFVLEEPLSSTSRIKSNGCSKTAEYLRQFYTNGVRIKEEG